MSDARIVDDGTETDHEVSVKVQHYIPRADRGRMHEAEAEAAIFTDRDVGIKGSIFISGANPTITIQRASSGDLSDVFTFDARDLIRVATAIFLEEHGPLCGACKKDRKHSNHEAPPDGKPMGKRHAFAG